MRMSIDQSWRRQGHAAAIVRDLVEHAAAMQVRRVVVRTDTVWIDAVAFYLSCGFTIVGHDDDVTDFELINTT
jgi:GNAT superfamily N-acetyltransferase